MLMKYSRLLSAVFVIAALVLSTACLRKQDRKQDYVPVSKQSLKGSGKLYFVPLGDFPAGSVEDLVSYYRDKYGLTIETLPSVPLPPAATNPEREQLIAEVAVETMRQANSKLSNDPQAILIGLTTQDMYIAQYDWRFSFSWREQQKFAVVSAARMNLPLRRRPVSEDEIQTRLRKMVTKNIGVLYYHLAQSDDPRSVLYRHVGGIRELDYMGEEF
jgi:predicted Zn-dependent protease